VGRTDHSHQTFIAVGFVSPTLLSHLLLSVTHKEFFKAVCLCFYPLILVSSLSKVKDPPHHSSNDMIIIQVLQVVKRKKPSKIGQY